ncbi:hypothetical protein Taro_013508 [Colocasia esculenta]|uniref:Uncharacterized protein n=1 Tax=Colocasia esculenta TaxID=4460 RepID=A0A843UJ06_COLES|nr:hypothetical protein [Colocasia esculenta]
METGRGLPSLKLYWWCLAIFLAFAVVCSARQTVTAHSGRGGLLPAPAAGRELGGRVRTNDYTDPSANQKHDPRPRAGRPGRGLTSP